MSIVITASPKKIYLSWSPRRGNPSPWKHFRVPNVMINAFDFWDRGHLFETASKTLSYRGNLFCDSGGYQVLNGRDTLGAAEVIDLQKKLGASLNAFL